jgi:mono/diheme cytochrome c family protein
MMRGTPGMRLTMAILSPIFLLLCVVAIYSEETQEWMRYQEDFKQLYVQRATAKLEEAKGRNDADETARWQRIIDEVARAQPEIAQIYLQDAQVADRCTTCHRGIDNPLFQDAPQPFRPHPGELLKHHDITRFGCTPCHQGQGPATTVAGGHGTEANWLTPLLPRPYVQAGCGRCHQVTQGLAGGEVASRGEGLFMEKGCYGCHDVAGLTYLPKYAPPLTALKSKLVDVKNWSYAWIKDPAHLSRDTMMPNFRFDKEELGKITAFLVSLPDAGTARPPAVDLSGASADEGKRLFTERGCRGCHGVEPDEHSVSPRVPHLAGVGSKVKPEWLDAWIADPKQYNPDTAMPKVQLTDDERRALVAYLLALKRSEPIPAAPDLSGFKADEGKQFVKRYECFGCHAIPGFDQVRPSVPNLGEFARKPVDELDFGRTTDVPRTKWDWLQRKLRDPRAYETDKIELLMPKAPMTEEEAQALIGYTLALDGSNLPARYVVKATPAQQALRQQTWMVAHLSCNGCHRLNQRDAHIAGFFERKNMVPPTLDGAGGRLQGQYMYQFVLEPKQVRPWLQMRMPTFGFGEADARTLVEGFAAAAAVTNPYTYVAKDNIAADHFDRGLRRFRHYKCVQCHPTSIDQGLPDGVDPEDLSINLMLTKTRLRPEWIRDFLARPKQIAGAQTRMPTVFYSVEGQPKVEKPQEDIDDITTYMMGMVEPPEVSLQAVEEKKAAEAKQQQDTDWTKVEY